MSDVMIDGPAGQLEASWKDAGGNAAAVLCHPHPQYGGSMHDMVLTAVEQALEANVISSLRFNFRGVGRSAGEYDDGVGEVEDVIAVAEWVRKSAAVEKLILVGYSFGGAVALSAAANVNPDKLILVAPAVGMFGETPVPTQESLVVVGNQDQFVPADGLIKFFPQETAQVEVLDGVDHFFMGAHDKLTDLVADSF